MKFFIYKLGKSNLKNHNNHKIGIFYIDNINIPLIFKYNILNKLF